MNADGVIHLPDPKMLWQQEAHSHTRLAKANGIPDGMLGDKWARFELTPTNDGFHSDVATWTLTLDEERQPEWWTNDLPAIDDKIRRHVARYIAASIAAGTATGSVVNATGYKGSASATGDKGSASATGYSGSASATGYGGSASATGYGGSASATGYKGSASATGYSGSASATGYSGSASATGVRGSASATGVRGSASATGYSGSASATGDRGSASATGYKGSAAVSVGLSGAVRGAIQSALVCAERDDEWNLIGWAFGVVGINGIEPMTWYEARGGTLVPCSPDRVVEIEATLPKTDTAPATK
jgi:hypothetical protein